jgi:hypothetical protein
MGRAVSIGNMHSDRVSERKKPAKKVISVSLLILLLGIISSSL